MPWHRCGGNYRTEANRAFGSLRRGRRSENLPASTLTLRRSSHIHGQTPLKGIDGHAYCLRICDKSFAIRAVKGFASDDHRRGCRQYRVACQLHRDGHGYFADRDAARVSDISQIVAKAAADR